MHPVWVIAQCCARDITSLYTVLYLNFVGTCFKYALKPFAGICPETAALLDLYL
jgi:hypothetical protein